MSNAEFSDETGTVRLKGTLKGGPAGGIPQGGPLTQNLDCNSERLMNVANPSASGDAATKSYVDGATGVRAQEARSGIPVTITNNNGADLDWSVHDSGATLIDASTPTAPRIIDAGLYAITVRVTSSAMTVGGLFEFSLNVGANVNRCTIDSPAATAAWNTLVVSLSYVALIPTNSSALTANVYNVDGAASRDFTLAATIVRLF